MVTTLEILPNEILLLILSNLSWSELLTSLWPLNKRFNILMHSALSTINKGLVITESGLSFNKCHSLFYPLSSFTSSIRRIHFDETNSISFDLIPQWMNSYDKNLIRFPNLKSLILTQCLLTESLIKTLSMLIKHQLDEFTFTFDKDAMKMIRSQIQFHKIDHHKKKLLTLYKELITQIFSNDCQLTSLRLDIACADGDEHPHQCLKPRSNISSCPEYRCITLRYLHIRIKYICFFEHFIESIPYLKHLSVTFPHGFYTCPRSTLNIDILSKPNVNWSNKLSKLESFTLKTLAEIDFKDAFLKRILNNVNYVKKLKIYLKISRLEGRDDIDANFIRRYCMPDEILSLIYFDFYIVSKCGLPIKDTEKIINSFQIHPFFVNHQCSNVKYFLDPSNSYQYLTSLNYKPRFFRDLICEDLFNWSNIRLISIDFNLSLFSFLEQLNESFPNVFCIKVSARNLSSPGPTMFMPFKKCRLNNTRLHNVTRLDFYQYFRRYSSSSSSVHCRDENIARAKLLAHLLSMPVQLKHLRIQEFEWLLNVIEYASDDLRNNALGTIRFTEFTIPSCHRGLNGLIHIGKKLVPFLGTYMPHLQTLCLWRPDDFPWTSIRPDCKYRSQYVEFIREWYNTLKTPESIIEHVNIFKEDLYQLFGQMKELVFLDIHGEIHDEKLEPYYSMVQTLFPIARIHIELFRFRLWL